MWEVNHICHWPTDMYTSVTLDISISSENQLIRINLGGYEHQVSPKKMCSFPQSVMDLCNRAVVKMMAKLCDIYVQI